jgi:hypothetical protein
MACLLKVLAPFLAFHFSRGIQSSAFSIISDENDLERRYRQTVLWQN